MQKVNIELMIIHARSPFADPEGEGVGGLDPLVNYKFYSFPSIRISN